MNFFACLTALLILGLSPARGADMAEVDGDRLGMTLAAFKEKYGRSFMGVGWTPSCVATASESMLLPARDAQAGVVSCARSVGRPDKLRDSFEGAQASVHYHFFQDRLFRILVALDSRQFEAVIGRLSEKSGRPFASRTETYLVRTGVPFANSILEWRDKLTTMTATKYAATVSQSTIVMQDNELQQEFSVAQSALGRLQASSSPPSRTNP